MTSVERQNVQIYIFFIFPFLTTRAAWWGLGVGVAEGEGGIPGKVEVLTYNRNKRDSVSVRPSLFFSGGLKFDSQVRLGP